MRPSLRQVLFRSAGLDLNFAGGVFSLNNTRTDSPANIPGWSFSRTDTNGTATALDLAGNVIQFATGVPRITNRGILVEEARTNLLLNSATLSTQTVTTTAVAHTLSFYGTGTVTLTGASTAGPLVGTGANNRVALTFTPIVGPLLLTVTGSVTLAQVEVGAFATSPIITTGAAGTRGAEVPFLALSDSAAYTIVAEGFGSPGTTAAILTSRDDTTSNNRVQIGNAGQVITYGAAAGGVSEFFVTTAITSIPSFKAAVRVAVNNAAVAINGAIVQTDTVFAVPATTRLAVGIDRFNNTPLNSYIQRIRILPTAITDAQLQSLTAP
jgi:hypothetical protein